MQIRLRIPNGRQPSERFSHRAETCLGGSGCAVPQTGGGKAVGVMTRKLMTAHDASAVEYGSCRLTWMHQMLPTHDNSPLAQLSIVH